MNGEIDWEKVKANLDRLIDQALSEIVLMGSEELNRRWKEIGAEAFRTTDGISGGCTCPAKTIHRHDCYKLQSWRDKATNSE